MQHHKTILGISPGTRTIGFGLIRNGDIVDWHVRSFKGRWCEQKRLTILGVVENIICKNNVQIVAMKTINRNLLSTELISLMSCIENFSTVSNVQISTHNIEDLKNYCDAKKRCEKELLVEYVRQRYPQVIKDDLIVTPTT